MQSQKRLRQFVFGVDFPSEFHRSTALGSTVSELRSLDALRSARAVAVQSFRRSAETGGFRQTTRFRCNAELRSGGMGPFSVFEVSCRVPKFMLKDSS